jgi:hypothetical protein
VKTFTCGLCAAFMILSMIGMTGCADNEAEATKLSKNLGDPGAPNPKASPATTQAPASSPKEFYERAQGTQNDMYKKGYPGSRKK